MFFVAAKIFWFFAQPLNLAIFLGMAALLALALHRRRSSIFLLSVGVAILALSTWTSFGALIMRPLEERYPRPVALNKVDGVIVLGGGFEASVNLARGGYELSASGDRFVEAAVLARRFPEAKIVITGGQGSLVLNGETDANTAPRMLTALGVAPERLILEGKSRDTYENAKFTREMVKPGRAETWLLVTSAFHMPRSMGLFRKADFEVTPWPVDYRTTGREGFGFAQDNPVGSLEMTQLALREWLGLLAYRLSGRTDALLP
ncbi:MAG: YdcF family protein [Rhizobiaceae bacterium]